MREGVLEKRGTLEKGSAMGVCSHSGVECMGGFEPGNVDFASAKYLDGGGFGSVWRVGGEYAAKSFFLRFGASARRVRDPALALRVRPARPLGRLLYEAERR